MEERIQKQKDVLKEQEEKCRITEKLLQKDQEEAPTFKDHKIYRPISEVEQDSDDDNPSMVSKSRKKSEESGKNETPEKSQKSLIQEQKDDDGEKMVTIIYSKPNGDNERSHYKVREELFIFLGEKLR